MSLPLSHFPPEILQIIFDRPHSFLTVKLWACGDQKLNNKLSKAITCMDLKHTPLLPGSFPAMLSNLHEMRQLYIESASNLLQDPGSWAEALKTLPTALETLHIRSNDVRNAFLALCPSTSPQDPKNPSSANHDAHPSFPALKDLSLKSCPNRPGDNTWRVVPIAPEELDRLPPTLTRLGLDSVPLHSEQPCFLKFLPRGLIELDAPIRLPEMYEATGAQEHAFEADWDRYPPPGLALILTESPTWGLTPAKLPSKLVYGPSFTFGVRRGDPFAEVAAFPRSLECLDVLGNIPGLWTEQLPPNLKELSGELQTPLDVSNIAHLPRSLTRLNPARKVTKKQELINWEKVVPSLLANPVKDVWPPTLTALDTYLHSFPPGLFKVLPRTLLKLELTFIMPTFSAKDNAIDIAGAELPPNLTTFKLIAPSIACTINMKSPLPSKVTTFVLHGVELTAIGGIKTKAMFESLPDSITDLKVQVVTFDPKIPREEFWSLPANLARVTVSTWRCNWFETLPQTLAQLIIERIEAVGLQYEDVQLALFEKLPSSLSHLAIKGIGSSRPSDLEFPPTAFSNLPNLEHLEVPDRLGRFTSNIFRHLPRDLRVLMLRIPTLSHSDLPFIPPKLRVIHFYTQMDWGMPGLAAHWPVMEAGGLHSPAPGYDFELKVEERRRSMYL